MGGEGFQPAGHHPASNLPAAQTSWTLWRGASEGLEAKFCRKNLDCTAFGFDVEKENKRREEDRSSRLFEPESKSDSRNHLVELSHRGGSRLTLSLSLPTQNAI